MASLAVALGACSTELAGGAGQVTDGGGPDLSSGSAPSSDASTGVAPPPSDATTDSQESGTRAPARGPTPPSHGTNLPFPQNGQSSHCTYPSHYNNDDVQAHYHHSKNATVTPSAANVLHRVH